MSKETPFGTQYVPPEDIQADLTEKQKQSFVIMRQAQNICLMAGTFGGEPTSLICAVYDDNEVEGGKILLPLYMEITPDMVEHLGDANGVPAKPSSIESVEQFQSAVDSGRISPTMPDGENAEVINPPRRKLDS